MEHQENANQLTGLRALYDGMKGHNYALPDCIKFIFEHLNEYDELDYWDIAAVTGDSVAMVYNHNLSSCSEYCVSGYLEGEEYITSVFDAFGFAVEYADFEKVKNNKAHFSQKIVDYIDRGVPVLAITNFLIDDLDLVGAHLFIIGYENGGNTLKLLLWGEKVINCELNDINALALIFIGEKRRDVSLEEIYLHCGRKMQYWLTLPERNGMYFGAAAFRAWANDIEVGRFEDENLDLWENYGVYVCNLATTPAIPFFVFERLARMNSEHSSYLELYKKITGIFPACVPDDFVPKGEKKDGLWSELEKLEAGLNPDKVRVTMKSKKKRDEIVANLREYANRLDKAVDILRGC